MNAAVDAIVAVLFAALWQGGLIALAVLGFLAFVPRASAATRHLVLWCGFLAIAVVPFALTLPKALPAAQIAHAPSSYGRAVETFSHRVARGSPPAVAPPPRSERRLTIDLGWMAPAIVAAWILGVVVACGRLLIGLLRVAQIRRAAKVVETRDGIPVCTSDAISVPIAAGLLRPAVILPLSLMQSLSGDDLNCIVLHELAHVRRGDVWGKLLQLSVQAVFFFNPALLTIGRRLSIEREIACDDMAAAGSDDRQRFARCLVDLAERVALAPATALGVLGVRNATFVRIRRLLDSRYSGGRRISRPLVGGVLVVIVSLVLALALFSPVVAFATPAAPLAPLAAPAAASVPRAAPRVRNITRGVVTPAAVAPAVALEPVAVTPAIAPLARSACSVAARMRRSIPPAYPDTAKDAYHGPSSALIAVKLSATGAILGTTVARSSGRADLDSAALVGARRSTYAPQMVNCRPAPGTYIYQADFTRD